MRRSAIGLIIVWLLGACSNVPLATVVAPTAASDSVGHVITAQGTPQIRELRRLTIAGAGPVAALTFSEDSRTIKVAYAQEGMLREWHVQDASLLRSFDVAPVERGATEFTDGGALLATGAGIDWQSHVLDDDYLGLRVWNTVTGELVLRAAEQYWPPSGLVTRNLVPALAVSPNATWVAFIIASADPQLANLKKIYQVEISSGRFGDTVVNFARRPGQQDFDVVALDAEGKFLAAADVAGEVMIFRFEPPRNPLDQTQAVVQQEDARRLLPLRLRFDAQRHWLAGVFGAEVKVWDLQSFDYHLQLHEAVGNQAGMTADLSFDPTGTLLAVGTLDRLQVWSVVEKKLIFQYPGTGVYAIQFSPDGTLLAWGDLQGVVHLFGLAK